jgi:hypothetical protein
MKKIDWIVISLIVLILAVPFILHFIFPLYYRYCYHTAYESYQSYLGLFPEKEGIDIICLEDSKKIDCTNKTVFTCGEKIELFVKIDNPNNTFYACMNMSYFGLPWVCSNKTSSQLLFQEPELVIPSIRGKIPFIEIYLFPPKNYSSLDDLFADISSSKKIMSLYRDVVC